MSDEKPTRHRTFQELSAAAAFGKWGPKLEYASEDEAVGASWREERNEGSLLRIAESLEQIEARLENALPVLQFWSSRLRCKLENEFRRLVEQRIADLVRRHGPVPARVRTAIREATSACAYRIGCAPSPSRLSSWCVLCRHWNYALPRQMAKAAVGIVRRPTGKKAAAEWDAWMAGRAKKHTPKAKPGKSPATLRQKIMGRRQACSATIQ